MTREMKIWEKVIAAVVIIVLLLAFGVLIWHFAQSQQPHGATSSTTATDPCTINGQVYCALNPDVTQATINRTICTPGWTTSIRPSTSYTNALKQRELEIYRYLHPNDPNWTMIGTEEDHRVPLELGGHPTDVNNLTPEDHPGSYTKDAGENKARTDVCNHRLKLIDAQRVFIKTYLDPYPGYIFPA